jgi:uncharacterized protein YgiM (DUF1202 family)
MFKMLVFLCAGLFATLYVLGRDGGAVRDGLAGKVPPLMASADRESVPATRLVEVEAPNPKTAKRTERVTPVVAASSEPTPAPLPEKEPATAVLDAAFPVADPTGDTGLTLALPLVDPETEAPAPQALSETDIPADPVVMYVSGSSVNVRSGPSAESEALMRLPRGEAVLVLPSDTPGWSMIRIEGDGVDGYIASRFLTESATQGDGL